MGTLEDYRRFYADDIRICANLHSPALVEAFAHVPREKYLGPPPWQIGAPDQMALSFLGMGSKTHTATDDPRVVYHTSARDPQLAPVLAKAFASRTLFKLKSVRLDAHEPTDTCILHRSDVCVSSAEVSTAIA